MSKVKVEHVACPVCEKEYRWNPKFAGRKVKCKGCEKTFRMPKDALGDTEVVDVDEDTPQRLQRRKDVESYEVDQDEEVKEPTTRCPSCESEIKASAVLCINCGFDIKSGKKVKSKVKRGPSGSKGTTSSNKTLGITVAIVIIAIVAALVTVGKMLAWY